MSAQRRSSSSRAVLPSRARCRRAPIWMYRRRRRAVAGPRPRSGRASCGGSMVPGQAGCDRRAGDRWRLSAPVGRRSAKRGAAGSHVPRVACTPSENPRHRVPPFPARPPARPPQSSPPLRIPIRSDAVLASARAWPRVSARACRTSGLCPPIVAKSGSTSAGTRVGHARAATDEHADSDCGREILCFFG